ncbi:MAG TPA: DNRLRE domain-containing protein [Bacteroidales bacterium]|nr:DNRLRE domain-containing protein [Bacteroidales bacterium]HRZ49670.1 DNRLRE domain-containing protein [Bacteroidales bacterium]
MKSVIFSIVFTFMLSALMAQTTVNLTADYDCCIGYDNYPNGINLNFNTAAQNASYAIPGTSGGLNVNRALIHFDLSTIPANATITSALLNLYALGPSGSLSGHTGSANTSYLQRVTQPWAATTVTWANQPTTTTANQDTLPGTTQPLLDYTNINVTQMVQDMMSTNNYGFMLRLVNEAATNALLFASLNAGMPAKYPKLVVTYTIGVVPCPIYKFAQQSICKGDSILLQGTYQKTTGLYFDTLTSVASIDSIIVTSLWVNSPVHVSKTITICHGDSVLIAGAYRKSPGIFTQTFSTVAGCDSIEHIQLSVTVVDTSIVLSGITLTANQTGATYQWINCEVGFSIIPGAVFQSYTPSINGSYAVFITYNGCTGISPCIYVSGISAPEYAKETGFDMVPNPAGDRVTLRWKEPVAEGRIRLYNPAGQLVIDSKLKDISEKTLDITPFTAGIYTLLLESKEFTVARKLVIE